MSDEPYPIALPEGLHPPHRMVLRNGAEQSLYMQIYPPGHIFNMATNPAGKVVLIGKRVGSQQRLTVWAQDIDKVIAALQYAKATLMPPVPKCACCGTTENLHRDLGSGGPYRCNSPDCMVY